VGFQPSPGTLCDPTSVGRRRPVESPPCAEDQDSRMGSAEHARHRGLRIARETSQVVGREIRIARLAAGLSQRRLGRLVGRSHSVIGRLERGVSGTLDLRLVAVIGAVLGLDLVVRMYPAGEPVRDRAHLVLLERLRGRIHASLVWRTEDPGPSRGDRRAADATIRAGLASNRVPAAKTMVEAETRLGDLQSLERRVRTKARDLGATSVILLVADTRHNRAVLDAYPEFRTMYRVSARDCLRALVEGRLPEGDALVLL
jgi:transcriptional regulator with XRE-family HTH domain